MLSNRGRARARRIMAVKNQFAKGGENRRASAAKTRKGSLSHTSERDMAIEDVF